jgi:sporulation protein YlmC with PRC-barrel domain
VTGTFIAKAFVVTVAVSALTRAPALAQAAEQPGASGTAPTVSSSQIIGVQGADEWLVSQLRGTAVVGSDSQKIGEVVDVLLDRSGQARAFIIGVGGVTGLGAKEIAIDLTQFHEIPAGNGARAQLKVPMTREQLALVPEFKPLPVPEATTGAAPGSSPERSR